MYYRNNMERREARELQVGALEDLEEDIDEGTVDSHRDFYFSSRPQSQVRRGSRHKTPPISAHSLGSLTTYVPRVALRPLFFLFLHYR